jgi:hypothetical protein
VYVNRIVPTVARAGRPSCANPPLASERLES